MDIKSYAEKIKQNTDLNFSIFTLDGQVVFGDDGIGKNLSCEEGIFTDAKALRTLFRINFSGNSYIGVISGTGEEQTKYAYLMSELFDNYSQRNISLEKEDFFKALLFGEIDEAKIKKHAHKYGLFDKKVCAILIDSSNSATDVCEVANYYSEEDVCFAVALDESECVLVKYCDEETGEYRSAVDFSNFLSQSIMEEKSIATDFFIGGTVEKLSKISLSYIQATDTKRMSKTLGYNRGIHSFKEFMLLHVLEELPEYKINEFHNLLTDYSNGDIFDDEEMVQTAEAFLENSLNISETARKLYLHRNTLMYRLDKIEKETGLNLRKFSDAVTFRLITLLKSLIK